MQRQPVESSNLQSVGFDEKSKTLEIEFKGGGVFQYTGATAKQHYENLMGELPAFNGSKGKYFNAHIKKDPALTCTKVSGAQPAA